jgi:hypothetical protein
MKKTIVLSGEIESYPSKIMLMNSALVKVMYNLGLLTWKVFKFSGWCGGGLSAWQDSVDQLSVK